MSRRKRKAVGEPSKLSTGFVVIQRKEAQKAISEHRRTKGRAWVHKILDGLHVDLLAFVAQADALRKKAWRQLGETIVAHSQALAQRKLATSMLARAHVRTSFMRMKPDNTPVCYLCAMATTTGSCSCTLKTIVQHVQEACDADEAKFSSFLAEQFTNPTIMLPRDMNHFQEAQLAAIKQLNEEFHLVFGGEEDSLCRVVYYLVFSGLKFMLSQRVYGQREGEACKMCGSMREDMFRDEEEQTDEKEGTFCCCNEDDMAEAVEDWINTSDAAFLIRAIRDD